MTKPTPYIDPRSPLEKLQFNLKISRQSLVDLQAALWRSDAEIEAQDFDSEYLSEMRQARSLIVTDIEETELDIAFWEEQIAALAP